MNQKKETEDTGKKNFVKRLRLGVNIFGFLFLAYIVLAFIAPHHWFQSGNQEWRFDSSAKSHLHNLYLGCKAYWVDKSPTQNCDVSSVTPTAYGFIQHSYLTIKGGGTKTTFTAQASHMDSTKVFEMNANGEIQEVTNQ